MQILLFLILVIVIFLARFAMGLGYPLSIRFVKFPATTQEAGEGGMFNPMACMAGLVRGIRVK